MSNDHPEPETEAQIGPYRPLGPRPLGRVADLAELLGGDTARSRKFLGGLAIGGLVGAAVAGASLLRRRGRGPRTG